MKNKELIKLTDGALINVKYEDDYIAGCPTCDWGSEYINNYTFVFSDDERLEVEVNNMYEYAFSVGDMMHILLSNIDFIKIMSKTEFCDWIVSVIKKGNQNESGYTEIPDQVRATYYKGKDIHVYEEEED